MKFARYIILFLSLFLYMKSMAVSPAEVRWANEAADTTLITQMLIDGEKAGLTTPNERVAFFARRLVGKPYVAGTLEGSPEMLSVNMDGFDCVTLVETAAALALTLGEGRNSWLDFLHNLEQIRYRQGRVNGYASRLHYASDWVVDNVHRGLLVDFTDRTGSSSSSHVKSIDFMTRNRDKYPALADSAEFARMKDVESAFRNHRYNYLRVQALSGKDARKFLKEGDILLLTTKTSNLDVSHEAIVVLEPDGIHLLHASSRNGKVVIDPLTLGEYLKKNPSITGARVIRVK